LSRDAFEQAADAPGT